MRVCQETESQITGKLLMVWRLMLRDKQHLIQCGLSEYHRALTLLLPLRVYKRADVNINDIGKRVGRWHRTT